MSDQVILGSHVLDLALNRSPGTFDFIKFSSKVKIYAHRNLYELKSFFIFIKLDRFRVGLSYEAFGTKGRWSVSGLAFKYDYLDNLDDVILKKWSHTHVNHAPSKRTG